MRGFSNPHHKAASVFLKEACATGKLGFGPVESSRTRRHFFKTVWQTIPWITLILQFVWSIIVVFVGFAIADPEGYSLSEEFWVSKLNVSSSVSYGVGWALFVLLGLYIREASNRYVEAQFTIHRTCSHLKRVVRVIRQAYPSGTWHIGDHDRLFAHLVSYLIGLKMTLRGERDADQLHSILHPNDAQDAVRADAIHLHCMRVVRAYIIAAQDDSYAFERIPATRTPSGYNVRRYVASTLDEVDNTANAVVRIAKFYPTTAYVNHLRIFLYIWMFFLPLALLSHSGW